MSARGAKLNGNNRRISFFTQLVSANEEEAKPTLGKSGTEATHHIHVRSLNEEIRNLVETTNLKGKINAVKKIGHMVYSNGGVLESVRR